jgi:hypothetical protein
MLSERNKLLFGPFGNFGSSQNMGYFWTLTYSAIERVSGGYSDGRTDLFSARVGYDQVQGSDFGFRCVARPSR